MRWRVITFMQLSYRNHGRNIWGRDPRDRRANGEKKEDIKDIAQNNLGLSSVLCNTNILFTLQLKWEVLSAGCKEALPNTQVFILIIMPFSFHVPMSLTAWCDPQGGGVMGVPQGSSPGIRW